ncbi:SURF1 family protein [Hansschlegelia quercus]|uniref:SURF1-like protein n=1 Tax=Hansschlegelia quercus TaxID=2528245 RepID=A0A4Q9GQA3_9HYPH|nr:SURF1 family protein [Hansschlegelia quercus]TBN54984.1 SURF1 family protein [Hansschlegelia quercus]
MSPAARRLLKVAPLVLVVAGLLGGLGFWQLERLAWKEGLVALVHERMNEPATPIPAAADWPGLDVAAWSYRRASATGTFDASKTVRVYTVLSDQKGRYGGPGYWILAPLALSGGGTVIINRGFAPEQLADLDALKAATPNGEVTITGVVREPEARNAFTPADAPDKALFFARDPAAIAAALGLSDAAPFTIDADPGLPDAVPQGGETRIAFPNRHLEYALTWFGLSATLVAFFAAYALRSLTGRT